jgi:hypothetical protein
MVSTVPHYFHTKDKFDPSTEEGWRAADPHHTKAIAVGVGLSIASPRANTQSHHCCGLSIAIPHAVW